MDHQNSRVAVRALELVRHGRGPGTVVVDRSGRDILDLDPRSTTELLSETGYLLFSGFRVDLAAFSKFVLAHSSRVTLDPARVFHGGKIAQKVDAGTDAMGLHLENGNSPFRPDLTWFFCQKAASEGSQTTVCDGHAVWKRISSSAKQQFEGQQILYRRRVEEPKWKTFVYHYIASTRPSVTMEEITLADFLALVEGDRATEIKPQGDGAIIYEYRTPAVHRTLFGERVAWANSIFGPSYNYEAPTITFGDGRGIPAALLEEMRALTDELTEDIHWRDGEVALIDNTRVMHGRRAIKDPSRTIFNALSYLAADLRTPRAADARA